MRTGGGHPKAFAGEEIDAVEGFADLAEDEREEGLLLLDRSRFGGHCRVVQGLLGGGKHRHYFVII